MPTHTFEDDINIDVSFASTSTESGYLVAPATLAREGVQSYYARELGVEDETHKPGDLIGVYRSAATLAQSCESFEGLPLVLTHLWIDSSNWRANAIGDVRDIEMRGADMVGTLIVRDKGAVEQIRDGKQTEMSNGYRAVLLHKPGTYEGQAYEFEQTAIAGNHVALVSASRCGPRCRIMDSAGCACGGTCETCKGKERDPRREWMKRMVHSWEKTWPPPGDDEDELGPSDDPVEAYKQRLARAARR